MVGGVLGVDEPCAGGEEGAGIPDIVVAERGRGVRLDIRLGIRQKTRELA